MVDRPKHRLRLVELIDPSPKLDISEEIGSTDFATTAHEMFDSMVAYEGSAEFFADYPDFENAATWHEIAFFSECEERGTITYHQVIRSIAASDCRYWFDLNPDIVPGQPADAPGWVLCTFRAPLGPALYGISLKLDSEDPASVECSISDRNNNPTSLGVVNINGETKPFFPMRLSQGSYTFMVMEHSGAFQFLSLTVHMEQPANTSIVPNVRNLPSVAAANVVDRAGLEAAWTGDQGMENTYVESQSPGPGMIVPTGSTVTMRRREGPTP